MKTTKIFIGGEFIESLYFEELPQGKELKELSFILLETYNRAKDINKEYERNEVYVEISVFLAFDISKEKTVDKGVKSMNNWIINILENALPDGLGVNFTSPYIECQLTDDDNLVLVVVISPVERTKRLKAKVSISDTLFHRMNRCPFKF